MGTHEAGSVASTGKQLWRERHPILFLVLCFEAVNLIIGSIMAAVGASFLNVVGDAIHIHGGVAKWFVLIGGGVLQVVFLMFFFTFFEFVLGGIGFTIFVVIPGMSKKSTSANTTADKLPGRTADAPDGPIAAPDDPLI